MNKVLSVVVGIWQLIAKEPAISAGLANVIVVIATAFGLHLTPDQLVTVAGFTAGIFAVLVRTGVIPLSTHKAEVKQALYTPVPETPKEGDK